MLKRKKMLALVMSSAMVLSCAGVGGASSVKADDELVTLQMLSLTSNTSGLQENTWWTDLLAENVGIQIELLPAGDQGEQKLQALMASGSLPDLVLFKDPKQVANAVAGDMLLAFDDYKDLLPDLYKNAGSALQYSSDLLSEGQNKAYSVGIQISKNAPTAGSINFHPRLRYDYYKEIGSPEIVTLEDYLPVLKQMQEAHPTNEDGKNVYGFSLWTDWDQSTAMVPCQLIYFMGCDAPTESCLVYKDVTDNTIHSLIEEDSAYLRALKFFFDANQMGLLDPDSMTQRFEDAQQKFTEGRAMFDIWGWGSGSFDNAENHAAGIGFMPVSAKEAKTVLQQLSPVGSSWSMAVSSSTKYPELCMKYMNYMYSDEGVMELLNGPKGQTWDVNEDGVPYITEEGYTYIQDGSKELPQGGKLGDGLSVVNNTTFQAYSICDTYGVPFQSSMWPTYEEKEDKLRDEWRADMGVKDQIEYLNKCTDNGILVSPFAPMGTMPDNMKQLEGNVGSIIQQLSWKMIYAKDEAEFDSLKEQMVEGAQAAGIDEYVEWYTEAFAEALETGNKYVQ